MLNVEKVQALNKSIEQINNKRTKESVRLDLLKRQLESDIAEYKAKYGKDLQGDSLKATRKNVTDELEAISSKLKDEYELKFKVVQAIEAGNFQEAYALLGVEDPSAEEDENPPVGTMTPVSEEGLHGLDEDIIEEESEEEEYEEESEEYYVEGDKYEDDESEGVYLEGGDDEDVGEESSFSDFEEEEEDEELEYNAEEASSNAAKFLSAVQSSSHQTKKPAKSRNATKVKGTSVAAAVESVDNPLALPEDADEDDTDLEDEDFGFGDIISGSKFLG